MQQPLQPRPKKKSGNGCLIALAIVGGLAAITIGLIAFGIYRFAGTKEGKLIFGVIGDATKLAAEAQSAPGAKEVRALGCDQAMAFDMDKMSKIMERFDASAPPSGTKMVVCQVGVFSKTPPACDHVARTYLAAAGPPARELLVSVTQTGGRSVCSSIYDPAGKKLRDVAPGSEPRVPTAQ
jgi:hypothetical protein